MITPVDRSLEEASTASYAEPSASSNASSNHYQLTHDYLVPSLRDWLTRKQRETRKGRAELRLAERTATWSQKRENKQLATLSEWISIRTLTESKKWTSIERTMMHQAARVHGTWWAGMLIAVLLIGFGLERWIAVERWQNLRAQTQTSVEALQNNLGPSIPFNLEKLDTLPRDLVLPELQTRFGSASNPRHKLSLAFGLAHFAHADPEYLISRIDDVAESDTGNYLAALASNSSGALKAIQAESAKCVEKSRWRRKAKLAITALNLGDTSMALDVCTFENRPDPEQRTLFIDEFRRWENNLKAIHDAVANSDSPALRSGICLAVGQISVGKIVDSDRESWKDLASKWFVGKSDTSTHSASGWLLRQWNLPIPEIPKPNEIVSERDWFVNSVNTTMLKMHPGKFQPFNKDNPKYLDREVEIKDYFWVADREITRGQFELFAKETSYPDDDKPKEWNGVSESASPTADHPAQRVSWYDAVMYCNWLSKREGRTPCYERSGVREKGRYDEIEYDAWRSIPGATGYRLLREVEWEYACRAGTQTEFCMGDDEVLLKDYCQMYPCKTAAMSGQKLPNAWGLHDFHGNACEWCEELFDNSGSSRVKRGGGWLDVAARCRLAARLGLGPSNRYDFMGFRLALSSSGVSRLEAEPVGGGTK